VLKNVENGLPGAIRSRANVLPGHMNAPPTMPAGNDSQAINLK
jgi:hypothetical protein